jgi:hypothetical protein
VTRIAARFREANYDIKVALRELLLCGRVLRHRKSRRARQVADRARRGTLRSFGLRPDRTLPFALAAAGHGPEPDVACPTSKGGPAARPGSTRRRCWRASNSSIA